MSVVITLTGLISYLTLPVDQYPQIAPPTVSVTALYPGATAEEIADTVAAPLEQQINGIANMLYMSSSSTSEGRVSITVTFQNGTNIDIGQVDVQNRIQSVLPQLPQEVRDLGITVRKGSTDILLIVHMFAADSRVDRKYIANYANLQVRERLLRTPGVGDVNTNAARDYAMRVWIDPERAAARDLTVQEIVASLRNNNLQVAGGAVGGPPFDDNPAAYQLSIRAQGRLETPEEFADAIIKRDAQGRVTRIGDVARVELGAQNYAINAYKSLEPAVSLSVQQAPNTQRARDVGQHPRDDGGARARFPAGRRLRDHLQPRLVHARRRGCGAGDARRGDDPRGHRRRAVPAALAHGDHPAARDPDLADRHARRSCRRSASR